MSRPPYAFCLVICAIGLVSTAATAGHLEDVARERIDARVEVLHEVTARLRAGERAEDMADLLYVLASDKQLRAFLAMVDRAALPPSHRPTREIPHEQPDRAPDFREFSLPPALADPVIELEVALAPGPYRLEEFYWRGLFRIYRRDHDAGIADLMHYVERVGTDRRRGQAALFKVAFTYSYRGAESPDPRASELLERIMRAERFPPSMRQGAAIRLGQIHWHHDSYDGAAAAFAYFASAFPDHRRSGEARLLAGKSFQRLAASDVDPPQKARHLTAAIAAFRDLADSPTPPAVAADQAEALYRMATCYHALKDDTQTTLILERLRRDHPKSGWASAHAMGNIWIWDEYLRLEASQENAVDGKE